MAAPIVGGITSYLQAQLTALLQTPIYVWDGEIPRNTPTGVPINLFSNLPVLRAKMSEGGVKRDWDMSDEYSDDGPLCVQVWANTRAAAETLVGQIETIFASASNWQDIQLAGGPTENPYYVYKLLLDTWTCVNEETLRDQESNLLYRGEIWYAIGIHGAISTT